MKQNDYKKYILMSFNMLPANFLVLQKNITSENNIKNRCGMR